MHLMVGIIWGLLFQVDWFLSDQSCNIDPFNPTKPFPGNNDGWPVSSGSNVNINKPLFSLWSTILLLLLSGVTHKRRIPCQTRINSLQCPFLPHNQVEVRACWPVDNCKCFLGWSALSHSSPVRCALMGRCSNEYWSGLDSDSAPNPLLLMYSVCEKVK